jgi:hypothetical protein
MDSEKEDMRWLLVRLSPQRCSLIPKIPGGTVFKKTIACLAHLWYITSVSNFYLFGGAFMKLGYSYRLSQYAFSLGLLGLALAGGLVFFLNLMTLRTERYQAELTVRFSQATQTAGEPEVAPSTEFSPPPDTHSLPRVAALQTVRMLRPMGIYLLFTGGMWVLLRGIDRKPTG